MGHLKFAVDRAVWFFGTQVEAAMDAATEALGPKAKKPAIAAARTRRLNQILGTPDGTAPKGLYRDPASIAKRR